MRIIIVGAGAVGSYLAERLAIEGQDVVVIEKDPIMAAEVQAEVDCLVVTGNGASAQTLEEAGITQTDLLIAVTSSDAVNVLASQAAQRFDVAHTIARVEDPTLREELDTLGVDIVIDPVEALTRELLLLVRKGGVSEIIEFADGRLVLIGGYVQEGSPMAGITLAELRQRVTSWDWIVTAVVRHGETFIARGDTVIEAGDHVLAMSLGKRTQEALDLMGLTDRSAHDVLIIGATRLAVLTAKLLSKNGIDVTLIDTEADRIADLGARHDRVVLVKGDPTDPELLRSEGVERMDVALALTGWDEINILSLLVAKALGVPKTVARFQRFSYVGLLAGHGIDAGVSKRLAAANAILRYVRRGTIHSVATFQDTAAEALELQVDEESGAVGKSLNEMGLPKEAIVGGMVRGKKAFVPHGDTVVERGDIVIVIAMPEAISAVEKLFG